MSNSSIPAPATGEYAPFYAGYITQILAADVRELLDQQIAALRKACSGLDEDGAQHRYADDKWSIKEVIGHLADAERIFAYRALCISRGDTTPLPGFNEEQYVAAADFDRRPLHDLVEEMTEVRRSTVRLLDGIADDVWERRGTVNGGDMTVRAVAYIIAGHTQHHLGLLKERYALDIDIPPSSTGSD